MLWRNSLVFPILVLLVLGGCASQVSPLIRQPPPENPSLDAVRESFSNYQGSIVRWGGTIASLQNEQDSTVIEVVARELGDEGRPKAADFSPGRFRARVDGFLDPAIYQQGREITVYGTIEDLVEGQIGEHAYSFPVVEVKTYRLWEPRESRPYYYPPYPSYYYFPHRFHPFWYYW